MAAEWHDFLLRCGFLRNWKEMGHLIIHDADPVDRHLSWLIFGVLSLVLAVVGTRTGEAWAAKLVRKSYRNRAPKQLWLLVAVQYLGGVFFVGYFLYKLGHFPKLAIP